LSSDIEVRMPADEKEGTEASVGKWLKKIGDAVKENEPLVEIATDKVTVEIAATANGVLGEIVKNEGDAVLPGDLLGKIRAGEVSAATTTVIPSERAARVEEPAFRRRSKKIPGAPFYGQPHRP